MEQRDISWIISTGCLWTINNLETVKTVFPNISERWFDQKIPPGFDSTAALNRFTACKQILTRDDGNRGCALSVVSQREPSSASSAGWWARQVERWLACQFTIISRLLRFSCLFCSYGCRQAFYGNISFTWCLILGKSAQRSEGNQLKACTQS